MIVQVQKCFSASWKLGTIQCLKYLQNLNDDAKMICQKCIPLKDMYFKKIIKLRLKAVKKNKKKKQRSRLFSDSSQRASEQILNKRTWPHTHTHTNTHSDPTTEEGPDFLELRTPVAPWPNSWCLRSGSSCRAAKSEPLGGTSGARCHAVCPYGFGWKDPILSIYIHVLVSLSWFSWRRLDWAAVPLPPLPPRLPALRRSSCTGSH